MAVVADSEPGRRLSPAFLQELQAAPTVRVTLAEGERKELPLVMGR